MRGIYAFIFLVSIITSALCLDCLYLTHYSIFTLLAGLTAFNGALSIDAYRNNKQFNR